MILTIFACVDVLLIFIILTIVIHEKDDEIEDEIYEIKSGDKT